MAIWREWQKGGRPKAKDKRLETRGPIEPALKKNLCYKGVNMYNFCCCLFAVVYMILDKSQKAGLRFQTVVGKVTSEVIYRNLPVGILVKKILKIFPVLKLSWLLIY